MKRQLLYFLLGSLFLVNTERLYAQIYVKEGGNGNGTSWADACGDLQEAINKTTTTNRQVWVAKGTYKPTRKASDLTTITPNNRDNAFVILSGIIVYGGFDGTETSYEQRDWKKNKTILSGDLGIPGNNADNAYHVVIAEPTGVLGGFTIQDGNANGTGTVTLTTSLPFFYQIERNNGGGIYVVPSIYYASFPNIIITQNQASNFGGGVYSVDTGTHLNDAYVYNNMARNGGGIFGLKDYLHVYNSKIIGNKAYGYGGGIHSQSGDVFVYNSLIAHNSADVAGAVYLQGRASYPPTHETVSFRFVTITANLANKIGGVHHAYETNPEIDNSIIWGNGQINIEGYQSTPKYLKSLVGGGTQADDNGNLNGNLDPLFVDYEKSDFRLQSGSPAIDKGDEWIMGFPGSTGNDLDGYKRLVNGNVDLGAYEYQIHPVLYVKEGGNGKGLSWEDAFGDLQEAINTANPGDTIWVAKGTYKPTRRADNPYIITENNRDNSFLLKKDIHIFGGFNGTETNFSQRNWNKNETILSGDLGIENEYSDNTYHVVVSADSRMQYDFRTTLDGFTITRGNANGGASSILVNNTQIVRDHGGGISCSVVGTKFSNLKIVENKAGNYGAGIYNTNGSVTAIYDSTIEKNEGGNGGGMFNVESIVYAERLNISNNKAIGYGGGIHHKGSQPLNMKNSLVAKNSANTAGGAYFEGSASSTLTNITLTDNSAVYGGGLHNSFAAPQIHNSIIWNNGNENINNHYSNPVYTYSLVQGVTVPDTYGNIAENTDPLFEDSANSKYQLKGNSPVIDKGQNNDLEKIDLAGNPRVAGNQIDLGAYEYQGTPVAVQSLKTETILPEEFSLEISPNPISAGQQAKIKVSHTTLNQMELTIYDLMGNIIQSTRLTSPEAVITMPGKPGIYILKIVDRKSIQKTTRIIVK